jgi:RHH-type rel operon transcriptional repressor/antitoxin RelB
MGVMRRASQVSGNTLNVRVSENIAKRLEFLSTKTKRPKSFYIKELLEEHLEEYEDKYLALERLNDKNAKYYTTEEVEKILAL